MMPFRQVLPVPIWGNLLCCFPHHLLQEPKARYKGSQSHAQVASSTMKTPAICGFSRRVSLEQGSTPGYSHGCQPQTMMHWDNAGCRGDLSF